MWWWRWNKFSHILKLHIQGKNCADTDWWLFEEWGFECYGCRNQHRAFTDIRCPPHTLGNFWKCFEIGCELGECAVLIENHIKASPLLSAHMNLTRVCAFSQGPIAYVQVWFNQIVKLFGLDLISLCSWEEMVEDFQQMMIRIYWHVISTTLMFLHHNFSSCH
jgi:hypothetical protein